MRKKGFLLFVIVLLFGCQKSKDIDFETQLERVKRLHTIEFFQKEDKSDFTVFELLEGEELKSHMPLAKLIFSYDNENLNSKNKKVKASLELFFQHKFKTRREGHHGAVDSVKVFSIIQVLKSKVENPDFTNDEQFSEIVKKLADFSYYFSKAKSIIKNPSREKLEYAISSYSQDYFYLKNELSLLIRKPDILKEDQIDFSQKNEEAQLAVKDFVAFLNSQLFELGE